MSVHDQSKDIFLTLPIPIPPFLDPLGLFSTIPTNEPTTTQGQQPTALPSPETTTFSPLVTTIAITRSTIITVPIIASSSTPLKTTSSVTSHAESSTSTSKLGPPTGLSTTSDAFTVTSAAYTSSLTITVTGAPSSHSSASSTLSTNKSAVGGLVGVVGLAILAVVIGLGLWYIRRKRRIRRQKRNGGSLEKGFGPGDERIPAAMSTLVDPFRDRPLPLAPAIPPQIYPTDTDLLNRPSFGGRPSSDVFPVSPSLSSSSSSNDGGRRIWPQGKPSRKAFGSPDETTVWIGYDVPETVF